MIRALSLSVLCALLCLTAATPVFAQPVSQGDIPDELELNFSDDVRWAELLGPLAPVALSPFFGITCLSGASMLMDQGLLPKNRFIQGNPLLNQPAVFFVFLVLTLATSLPKFSKVSKPLAQALDHVEAYAGVITMLVLQHVAQSPVSDAAAAGVLLSVQEFMIMALAATNMLVIHTVKFFFETLILISPIPLVDALFETANKATCAGLVLIYSLNPAIALAINILLFAICLCLVRWCHRKTVYYRHLILDPITHKLLSLIGAAKPASIVPGEVLPRQAAALGDATIALPVFPTRRIGDVPKQARCYLVGRPEHWRLLQPRFLRKPLLQEFTWPSRPVIDDGWIANVIVAEDEPDTLRFQFSSRYDDLLPDLAEQTGFELNEGTGAGGAFTGTFAELGARIAASIRG